MTSNRRQPRSMRPSAFTLLELLVVMGILLILAVLTAVSVGKVTRDAKLANATNTIVAALGNARAVAIRDNSFILVTFRIAPDRRSKQLPSDPQVVRIYTAKWTGEILDKELAAPAGEQLPASEDVAGERFIVMPGVPQRDLPAGVMVAGPAYGRGTDSLVGAFDDVWITQPRFAGTANYAATPPTYTPDLQQTELGNAIGVLFGPDGRLLSRLPGGLTEVVSSSTGNQNAWEKPFLDLDGNGYPRCGNTLLNGFPALWNLNFFYYDEPTDEPYIDLVPCLAVYNEAEARERFNGGTAWKGPNAGAMAAGGEPQRSKDLSSFINEQADIIRFNHYSGVPGLVTK